MAFETIKLEEKDAVAIIRLARPDQMNALAFSVVDELGAAFDRIMQAGSIRAIVITGEGPAFCAGADLKEVLSGLQGGAESKRDFLDTINTVFNRIRQLPLPVIGGLNGITMAGGLELAMCCDILIAAESAKIGDAHSNFGVFPGAGGASVLPKRVGPANAKYLLFTGDALPANRLLEMGLVQEVVADDALEDRLLALAKKLAAKSPLVLRRMKQLANMAVEMSEQSALKLEIETLRNHFRSEDMQEGLKAFQEKRKPVFSGR